MATICRNCGGMVPDRGPHVCGQWAASHIEKLKAQNIKLEAAVTQMSRAARSLEKRLEELKKEFNEWLDQENIPRKYYDDGMIYGVYGSSSISYVEVLLKRLKDLKEQAEAENARLRDAIQTVIDSSGYITDLDLNTLLKAMEADHE
jgi:chaperonin cofactor prefoldin